MTEANVRQLFIVLYVAFGIILAVEGIMTLTHAVPDRNTLHVAFGAAETMGALLFLWPRTMRLGAMCCLLPAFAAAAMVHIGQGEFPSEHLVYAIATVFATLHGARHFGPRVEMSRQA
jgi:hypothetical protein